MVYENFFFVNSFIFFWLSVIKILNIMDMQNNLILKIKDFWNEEYIELLKGENNVSLSNLDKAYQYLKYKTQDKDHLNSRYFEAKNQFFIDDKFLNLESENFKYYIYDQFYNDFPNKITRFKYYD